MKNLQIIDKPDVRNIVINELRKKEKIISIGEIKLLIRQEIIKQNKDIYRRLDHIRKTLKGGSK